MKRGEVLNHEFVDFIPDVIKDGTIYVSIAYATATHKCCCGCGKEVVTPFSQTDWTLIFDGQTISLNPSVGSWSLKCKSHYWIKKNQVIWAEQWSEEEVKAGRRQDHLNKKDYFSSKQMASESNAKSQGTEYVQHNSRMNNYFWSMLKRWWSSVRAK